MFSAIALSFVDGSVNNLIKIDSFLMGIGNALNLKLAGNKIFYEHISYNCPCS